MAEGNKSLFKKLVIGMGGFAFLLLAAVIIIPLVVDVDQYRPEIVKLANEHINGKLEIGKLKLSLWGQIRVEVDGLKLSDKKGARLVSVDDAYFHLPFTSLFSGSPVLTFKMIEPTVIAIKDKNGKLNLMGIAKKSAKPSPGAAKKKQVAKKKVEKKSGAAETIALPALATNARMGIEFRDANLTYKDLGTGLVNEIKNLNVVVKDISLTRPMSLKVWADLDTRLGKSFNVKGPIKMEANLKSKFKGIDFDLAQVEMFVNLDDLEIRVPDLFYKKKGIPANLKATLSVSSKEAIIDLMERVVFFVES